MITDNNDNRIFINDYVRSFIVALSFVLLLLSLSSCKLFKQTSTKSQTSSSDSLSVKRENESLNKVDTSKSKSESTYTKETFIFPPRDTIINKFYNSYPTQYIRETGTKTEETQNYNYETRIREVTDSIRIAMLEQQLNKQTEVKIKAGPSLIEWILIAGLGLLLIKNFAPTVLKKVIN